MTVFAIAAGSQFSVALVRDRPPLLTILRNPGQTVSLSWRSAAILEETESMTAPDWQRAPIQDNPQFLSTTGAARLYRMKAE